MRIPAVESNECWYKGEVKIRVPLTALEYGDEGEYFRPSSKIVEKVDEYRETQHQEKPPLLHWLNLA